MKKVMWVKFGWSDYYRGGAVDGNFQWLKDGKGQGHEAYNFMPGSDGAYYCFVPPHGPYEAFPSSADQHGWTVVCLAKFPTQKGIHVVGWYENATLMNGAFPRPEYSEGIGFRKDTHGYTFNYHIKSEHAYFIPPEARTVAFSHSSVKQAKFSYLSGPDIAATPAKEEVLTLLEGEMGRLRGIAVYLPNPMNAVDGMENDLDPLQSFGTPAHRKAVEHAAELAVQRELESLGYRVTRRADEKIGYDLQAWHPLTGKELLVEVKGTSGTVRRFFMTPNEHAFMSTDGWRLAMVTQALDCPSVVFLTHKDLQQNFLLQPMVWVGREVVPNRAGSD